jgi:hypothetical protein
MVVLQPLVHLCSKSLYQIETVEASFGHIDMNLICLESLRLLRPVSSQSIDIRNRSSKLNKNLEQVVELN